MKVEIEVELPEDVAKDWEVVAIRKPRAGEFVLFIGGGCVMVEHCIEVQNPQMPRVILRRKLNPREWWPKWLTADRITFEIRGVIGFCASDGVTWYWVPDTANILDFCWIPEHLRRSGMTIENPWKGEKQ